MRPASSWETSACLDGPLAGQARTISLLIEVDRTARGSYNTEGNGTYAAPATIAEGRSMWIGRFLNDRLYELPAGVTMLVREGVRLAPARGSRAWTTGMPRGRRRARDDVLTVNPDFPIHRALLEQQLDEHSSDPEAAAIITEKLRQWWELVLVECIDIAKRLSASPEELARRTSIHALTAAMSPLSPIAQHLRREVPQQLGRRDRSTAHSGEAHESAPGQA